MSCAWAWPPAIAIHAATAAINQPLPKAEIDIAALPCMKSPPRFFIHRMNHASPGPLGKLKVSHQERRSRSGDQLMLVPSLSAANDPAWRHVHAAPECRLRD